MITHFCTTPTVGNKAWCGRTLLFRTKVTTSLKRITCKKCAEAIQRERIICQFCGGVTFAIMWKNDCCPKCKRRYDAILAQEGDD